ncbi:MAG: MFS transporter [Eubacteriales bacterium]
MKNQYFKYIGVYVFSYFSIGVLFPLLGQYLNQIGYSGTQIGTITASATGIGILSSPFWGSIYERKNNNIKLLSFLYIAAALLVSSLSFINNYWIFLIVYTMAFFFESPIRPLNDAMTINSGQGFGKIRKWGSIGFGAGVFLAGLIATQLGLVSIFVTYGITILTSMGFVFSIGKSDDELKYFEKRKEKMAAGSMKSLLSNKKYLSIIACAFFINGTIWAHNTYFGFIYVEGGGTLAGIGVALLLMVFSEFPVMAFSDKITLALSVEKLILIAMVLSTGRFLWYGTGPDHIFLTATFFLQGLVNGLTLISMMKYVVKTVDPKSINSAVTLYTAVSSNASAIFCLFIGGVLMDNFGAASVYTFFGMMNLVGIAVYLVSGMYKEHP